MYWDLTECCWHVSLLLHALHWNFRLIRWCVPQWSFQAVVGLGAAVTAAVLTWLWLRLREEEDEVVFRETSVRLLHQNMLNRCLETLILMLCQAVHLQPLHQHCVFCYDEDTFHRWSTGMGLGMSFWYMRRTAQLYFSTVSSGKSLSRSGRRNPLVTCWHRVNVWDQTNPLPWDWAGSSVPLSVCLGTTWIPRALKREGFFFISVVSREFPAPLSHFIYPHTFLGQPLAFSHSLAARTGSEAQCPILHA